MRFRKFTMPELERLDADTFRKIEKLPILVILDNVRSALNVGSVFRTADAFAIESVVLCGISAQPPHKEILKTALGSAHSMSWAYFEHSVEAVKHFKSIGYKIIAVEQVEPRVWLDELCSVVSGGEKVAFVFGNEVDGVSDEVLDCCDLAVEIPQFGTKHSLNVAVSVGVVLWEAVRLLDRYKR